MAKKSSVEREKKRLKMSQRYFEKRESLKAKIKDPMVGDEEKLLLIEKLNKLPKNSSYVRRRNRCQFTGRSRAFLRKFKMSRICFRKQANQGTIPGVVKASW